MCREVFLIASAGDFPSLTGSAHNGTWTSMYSKHCCIYGCPTHCVRGIKSVGTYKAVTMERQVGHLPQLYITEGHRKNIKYISTIPRYHAIRKRNAFLFIQIEPSKQGQMVHWGKRSSVPRSSASCCLPPLQTKKQTKPKVKLKPYWMYYQSRAHRLSAPSLINLSLVTCLSFWTSVKFIPICKRHSPHHHHSS